MILEFKCDCVAKVNEQLAKHNLQLAQRMTINLETGETGKALSLETVSLKRGVKARPIAISFCPFCGIKGKP
jgi:hypothetical protein